MSRVLQRSLLPAPPELAALPPEELIKHALASDDWLVHQLALLADATLPRYTPVIWG